MLYMDVTEFQECLFTMLEKIICDNETIHINIGHGNAVVLSEANYRSMMETIFLSSNPTVKKKLASGMKESLPDCIPEKQVVW